VPIISFCIFLALFSIFLFFLSSISLLIFFLPVFSYTGTEMKDEICRCKWIIYFGPPPHFRCHGAHTLCFSYAPICVKRRGVIGGCMSMN
jgi:hypothetical protein